MAERGVVVAEHVGPNAEGGVVYIYGDGTADPDARLVFHPTARTVVADGVELPCYPTAALAVRDHYHHTGTIADTIAYDTRPGPLPTTSAAPPPGALGPARTRRNERSPWSGTLGERAGGGCAPG